jgi:hypothetical protein
MQKQQRFAVTLAKTEKVSVSKLKNKTTNVAVCTHLPVVRWKVVAKHQVVYV